VTTAEKEPTDSVPRPSYQQLLDGDSRAVPRALRQTYPFTGGPDEIPVRRYLDRGYHELEKSRLWSRVWQVACRDEQIPSVGDTWVYDIADKSYLIVRTGTGPDDIVAYPNACLHRGRTLRDGPGRVTELQCSFHGFCWHLDGGLKRIPSPWDFPHVDASAWGLRHLRVGRWGGFVFVNPDPDCQPLAEFLGVLSDWFDRWPLDRRYIRTHVTKTVRANWKLVQEAFMESYHVVTTHPQLLPGFGDANTQYDANGHVARAISPRGVASPLLGWTPSEQQQLDSAPDTREDDPPTLLVGTDSTARLELARVGRATLRPLLGDDVDDLCDAEIVDSYFANVFPNVHPWGAYNQIFYRFRPSGDDHTVSEMEVMLLAPFVGERPAAAEVIRLGADDHWRDQIEALGSLARVFDQDEFNLEAVQRGLRATGRTSVTLSKYQESKIRHFHALYAEYLELAEGD